MAEKITLDEIANLIKGLQVEIRQGNEQFQIYREQLENTKQRVSDLEGVQIDIIRVLDETQSEVKYLRESQRRNNLMLFNIKEEQGETTSDLLKLVRDIFLTKLEISLMSTDISNIYRVGKIKDERPILIKLHCLWQKFEILKAAKKLRGSNISISEDFSPE
uniref:Uncharacterized protein n=1 Tax=Rhodnius prolixus TaxID=13249 RepID=T1HHG9_RHOPR